MARRNRETLKNYFSNGKRPSQQDFADLIDSTLNTLDDGFSAAPLSGICLTPQSDAGVMISIFKAADDHHPAWELAIDKTTGNLQFLNGSGEDAKCLLELKNRLTHPDEKSGQRHLSIDGNITYKSRTGSFCSGHVKADGEWHDILVHDEDYPLGCWAFEIAAGCGDQRQKKYALAMALSTHCYGKKARIKTIRSHAGRRKNRIKLRWIREKKDGCFRLQIKTISDYKSDTRIHYQLTSLWDNPLMNNN